MDNSNGRLYFGTGIDNSGLRSGASEARQILQSIGSTAQSEGNRIDEAMKKVGTSIAGYFAVDKIKEFVTNVANVRGEFQQLEQAFKTMLGSEEQATALMSQLINTAATTPFGMTDVAQGAKQLLAYGVQAEEVNETLIRLGDIAAGLSIPLNDLAYLYGTTMVQGRLYTQDLNQFLGRGIPLTEELANQFGVTKDKVKDLVTEGKVGFEQVKEAIVALTSEGGQFGGLMEAQSQTISGQISNIEDSFEQMFNEIGKKSEGAITSVLNMTSEAVERWEDIGKVLLEVITVYGSYKAALIAVAAVQKAQLIWGEVSAFISLTKEVKSAKDAMLLFNLATKANPFALLGAAIASVVTYLVLFKSEASASAKMQEQLNDATKDYNKSVASEQVQIDSMFARLKTAKKGTEEYKSAKDAILNQYGKYLNGLSDEVKSLSDVESAYRAVSSAARDAAKARAMEAFQKSAADTYATTESDQKDKLYNILKDKFGDQKNPGGTSKVETNYWELVRVMEGQAKVNENWLKQFDEVHTYSSPTTGIVNSYTTNPIRGALEKVSKAKKAYNDLMDEAERRFGDNPLDKKTSKSDAKSSSNNNTASSTSPKNTSSKGGSITDLAEQAAQRSQQIAEYGNTIKAQIDKTELDIRQEQINLLEEGYEKQKEQIQLNYDRLISENKQREQQMLEALADKKTLEWEQQNPKAKESQKTAYRNSLLDEDSETKLTRGDLSSEQQAQLEAYEKIASETKIRANKEAINTMLQDCLSYEQQREEIAEEYKQKIENLYEHDETGNRRKNENGNDIFIDGASQSNVNELVLQQTDALSSIDEQFAQREETYKAWCEEIANMSLQQLQSVLEKAQEALKSAEKDSKNGNNSQQLATARAKVTTAQNKIKQQSAKNDVKLDKDSVKEWENLADTLNDVAKSFNEIGDTVGGVVGDILTTAGQVTTSTVTMINGITTLVSQSSSAMVGTAQVASQAIQTVEKGSVILAVISAALQIAMAIVNLFNDDESKQEEIENLQARIDQLQWELDNADVVRLQEANGKAIDLVKQKLSEVKEEMVANIKVTNEWERTWYALSLSVKNSDALLEKSAEKLATAYANVKYTADKAIGEAKYDEAREQLENIAQQQLLIQEQIETEKSKKDVDDDQITEWEEKIEELGEDAVNVINEMVEDIIGGSSSDIAEQLSDAFFDAFEDGTDYAQAWHDEVTDLIADITKNLLVQKFLEEPLGEIFDKYKSQWFQNGKFMGIDNVLNSLSDMTNDLNAVGDEWVQIWEALPQQMQDMITSATDSSRESSSSGIANASQDSVDELNGRATAIQGHTYSINENTKLLLSTTNLILQSVLNIETNTDGLSERMATVEGSVKEIRNTVNDIALKGIKIK